MIMFLGIMLVIMAAMLVPMGYQQFTRKYYVAASVSLIGALVLIAIGVAIIWQSV